MHGLWWLGGTQRRDKEKGNQDTSHISSLNELVAPSEMKMGNTKQDRGRNMKFNFGFVKLEVIVGQF